MKVIPTGWNQALMACQMVHEAMVVKIEGISATNRMADGGEVPKMDPLVHAEYVDNFAAYAGERGPVAAAARQLFPVDDFAYQVRYVDSIKSQRKKIQPVV